MKLLRFGPPGQEQPGLLDKQGRIRSLAGIVWDITSDIVTPEGLARLRELDPEQLPLVEGTPRLGPPVARPRQFMALGLNYALHAKEANVPIPTHPMVFSKAVSCISGANDDIPIYPGSVKLDYEAELAVVIGSRAHRVTEAQALEHVAGYCICNDVSEREWQIERGGTLSKGKSAPGYGPLGPWLVTKDEVPDAQVLRVRTYVNGEARARWKYLGHDLPSREIHRAFVGIHGAVARRRSDNRDPGRRRPRHEAAAVAAGRGRGANRNRRLGGTAAARDCYCLNVVARTNSIGCPDALPRDQGSRCEVSRRSCVKSRAET